MSTHRQRQLIPIVRHVPTCSCWSCRPLQVLERVQFCQTEGDRTIYRVPGTVLAAGTKESVIAWDHGGYDGGTLLMAVPLWNGRLERLPEVRREPNAVKESV